jgi:hypothetical protein
MSPELMKLQYEILNVSLEHLAKKYEIPLFLLEKEAKDFGWKQVWPNEPEMLPTDEENTFAITSDAYIENARKRLMMFSLAKEILLSQEYLNLEYEILKKASTAIKGVDATAVTALKTLSALYKDMSRNLLSAGSNAAISVGTDEGGLPTVIIRDLSGQQKK